MSNTPAELKYTKSHEWVETLSDGTLRVGITDHAQESLGDIVFAETPEAGRSMVAGESCAVVESVKAASDIYAPVAGEVVESNEALVDRPELINQDPYGDGWLWKMKPATDADLGSLLDADAYNQVAAEG